MSNICRDLHRAVARNNVSEVTRILSLKTGGVNCPVDVLGRTALHVAASLRNFEVSKVLLEDYRADVNVQDHVGNTPLYYLVGHATVEILKLYLDHGAKPEESMLSTVVEINRNPVVLEMLIDRGNLNVNHRDKCGRTAAHLAGDIHAFTKFWIIKCLLKYGADVNVGDSTGWTPLTYILSGMQLGWDDEMSKQLRFVLEHADLSARHRIDLNRKGFNRGVLKHLAKMEVLGLPLHQHFKDQISEHRGFHEECILELERAKREKLKGSWVSFFNLLVDDRRRLKNYAGNEKLREEFQKYEWERKFPIYGSEMREKVRSGIERRELYDRSADLLSESCPIFNPTHLVVRDVLDCVLSKKDLTTFCRGCKFD